MKLYIIRHGRAEYHCSKGDSYRSLTQWGEYEAETVGHYLKNRMEPDLIITSPLKRAVDTADIIISHLPELKAERTVSESARPESSVEDLLIEVEAWQKEEVMIISHNPLLTDFVYSLSEDKDRVSSLGTCTLVVLDFQSPVPEPGKGKILEVITPEEMRSV